MLPSLLPTLPPAATPAANAVGSVLLIGGNDLQAECPAERLVALGFRSAGFAQSTEEAAQLARTNRPDAILIDFDFVAATCATTLVEQVLRAHRAPVLFLINQTDTITLTRAQSAWAQDCIARPLLDSELKPALRMAFYRHQVEVERQAIEARLVQSQKMEAIGRLAGGIAHDFNNLLAAIQSFTELTQSDLRPDDPCHEYLRQVLKASAQARDLVKQILTYSRQKPQPRKPVALQPTLKEVVKFLRSTLPANLEVVSQIQPSAPLALADPTQIYEVVMHLGVNGWHAMGQHGRLSVSLEGCRVTPGMPPEIVPVDLPAGEYLRLTVADTGCGMDPAILDRIFEPFFTTKPVGQGSGLGLSVVLGIVRSHQGGIAVESQPGTGTTVRVYLPAATTATASPRPAAPVRNTRGNGERILLVDDEAPVGESIKRILERLGYQVTLHDSAENALTEFRAAPATFTAVMTDYCMPGMTGVELAREIKSLFPHISVVLTTGLNPQWSDEEMKSMGIHLMLAKPATSAEIAATITQAVQATHGPIAAATTTCTASATPLCA
ncbi:MAG: response regulator [Proteobacteria bacterium]|nr:response regulator [Pseudomonadota bacterium]